MNKRGMRRMQNNQLKNAKFLKHKDSEIEYFTSQGYYLGQKVSGYYTCVALENSTYPIIQRYIPPISTIEKKVVLFGYTMRAMYCEQACFVVTFFDEEEKLIGQKEKKITKQVRNYYTPIMEKFYLPKTCASAKVQLIISGKVQGLSFFAPTVYVV